jgi:nitrous oxide reductase accessory protein NosL
VTAGCRKLHKEEYNYNAQVEEDEMGRACSMIVGEEERI